jgi:nucleoid-associated protein YgaU
MARETKVGLLAGLAFIICFAVILANRGANGPPGLTNSFLPKGGLDLPKMVQRNQAAAGDTTANAARNRNQRPIHQPQQELATNHPGNAGNPAPGLSHAANEPVPATGAQLPIAPNVEPAHLNPESTLAQNTRPIDAPANANAGLERALTSPVPMTATMPLPSESAAAPGRLALNEPAQVLPATAQPSVPIQGTPYTVKASDTLSSIASAHYGTKSKQAVETIFDANRSVLTDINNVKMGAVLMIPKLPGTNAEKDQPTSKPPHASGKVTEAKGKGSDKPTPDKKSVDKETVKKVVETVADSEKNPRNFKWYQVKKNDRFASIAREQLGDAGRWHEVYELNKDKFPDPQHIREGVRIKLPSPITLASASKEKGH